MAMAVQAHCPSQSFTIFQNDGLDHQQQNQLLVDQIASPLPNVFSGGTLFGEAGSGLTSNFPGARKRRREEPGPQSAIGVGTVSSAPPMTLCSTHPGEDGSSLKSSFMSTSGRTTFPPYFDNQASEIDAIIRHEYEMRTALVEMATKRYKRLVFMLGQSFQGRLKEKEMELHLLLKRNQELEENLKQIAAETQLWIAHAKNNEAVVAALQDSLEQALHRCAAVEEPREGYGDSPGCYLPPAEDDWSSCYDGEEASRRGGSGGGGGYPMCKTCGVAKACVLVLPCRHLCLCQECEQSVGKCPVCNSVKNAGVQVFIS